MELPITYVLVGRDSNGQVVETYKLHRQHWVETAFHDLRANPAVVHVLIISLCRTCGAQRLRGQCLNEACPSRRKALMKASV